MGALVGAGVVELWRLRARFAWGRPLLGAGIVATAWWSAHLLDLTPTLIPGLRLGILAVALAAALVLAIPAVYQVRGISFAGVVLGVGAMLAGPTASPLYTINTGYSGSIVSAGPAVSGAQGGGPGGFGGGQPANGGFGRGGSGSATTGGSTSSGGGQSGTDGTLASYLMANKGTATWIVATGGSGSADTIELATGEPVRAMGGFTGSDPTPTLDRLKAYVASGQLRYVLIGGQGGPGGGTSDVTSWVEANGTVVDYGGSSGTLYDLSGAVTTTT